MTSMGRITNLLCAAGFVSHGTHRARRAFIKTAAFSSKKNYHLVGTGSASNTKIKTSTKHEIVTDVPKSMGGSNLAAQPVEYLLASYIGCTQATALFVGRNMVPRLLIDRIEYDIHGDRDQDGAIGCLPINEDSEFPSAPARLSAINGQITVYAKNRKGDQMLLTKNELNLLEIHTERRCPVANMITMSGCEINVKWIDGNAS